MRCLVHSSLDEEYFEQRVQEVADKMEGEEMIEFTFLFLRDMGDCPDMMRDIGDVGEKVVQAACKRESSASFRLGEEEYIFIIVDQDFLQEDESALRGLIAHELIHTVHRHSGLEKDIEDAAFSRTQSIVDQFMKYGFTEQEAVGFVRDVVSTMVFCLKDIFANTALIRQSFSSDLEDYYYHMLDVQDYCPLPEFYNEEQSLNQVKDAINFELRLMPAWLPFDALDSAKADKIRGRLEECYHKNIPQTSYYINKVRPIYHDEYNNRDVFINKFFDQVIESSFELIEKKAQEHSDQGSPEMFE